MTTDQRSPEGSTADRPVPETIDEVIKALDDVVEESRQEGSRLGYFPALYRTVTATVKRGIDEGFFDDGPRMEQFDVAFAELYFKALRRFRKGGRPSRSWEVACEGCSHWRPVILQHLLTGMNAHINLDLGIAAARTAPGDRLPGLRRDFDRINEILASAMGEVRAQMADVSPFLGILDQLGGPYDDAMIRFSIERARSEAWWFALELAPLDPTDRRGPVTGPIEVRDRRIAGLGRHVLKPGWLRGPLLAIRLSEDDDVSKVLAVLDKTEPPDFDTIEARLHDRAGP